MTVSIVIPAFNEERLLGQTLEHVYRAVEAFRERGWKVEVIVCDNNSTDRTAEVARVAGARVVFEPVNQISRARNAGAAAAGGDWLVFIDADSLPTRDLLRDVAEQIVGGHCLAGGSTMTMESDQAIARALLAMWNSLSRFRKLMAGSFIFCEARAFREVGGFSSELFVGEEIDLSNRLKRMARRRHRQISILDRYPLQTSARKLHLYRKREYAWFMLRAMLTLGRSTKNRAGCIPWYDGRR